MLSMSENGSETAQIRRLIFVLEHKNYRFFPGNAIFFGKTLALQEKWNKMELEKLPSNPAESLAGRCFRKQKRSLEVVDRMREKKNRLALRVLSTAALMAMVSSIATAAFADTYYVDYGDIKVDGSSVSYHDASGNSQTNEHDENIIITNSDKEESTSNTVTINAEEGSTAKVTLKDVNIDTSSKDEAAAAVTVTGNGTTSMELDGKNTLTSGGSHAGLEKNDAEGTGNLVIRDDTKDGGSLKAAGGSEGYNGGAGIGSSCGNDTSKIEIAGGKVEAVGGQDAAGIGSGASTRNGGGDAKQIKISGGDVTAVGKDEGAGIGGSLWGSAEVEISGGKVSAESGYGQDECAEGAGIGGGSQSSGVSVKITGGTVNAKTEKGAAIGGGYYGDENLDIDISGKDTYVNAEATDGSGIGGGEADMSAGTIKISGGTVIASGDSGIGTGDSAEKTDTTIEISGGNVKASGLAGIGTGSFSHESKMKIKISGGNVTATGAGNSAGIGMGPDTREDHVEVELTGGNITAFGGTSRAAAIGGGIQRYYTTTDVSVKIGGSANPLKLIAKSQGSNEGTIGEGAVDRGSAGYIPGVDGVNFDEVQNMTADTLGEDGGILVELYNNYDPKTGTGTRYKCVHNRAYVGYPADADINEAHAWDEGVIVEQAAPGKPGTIRYTCTVDGCGATKEVSYDYVEPGEKQLREVGVIFWDAAAQAAPKALQGKKLSVEEQTTTVEKEKVESLLADKANWKLAEDVLNLKIHPAADAVNTVYEQAVKESGCEYYVIANVTAQ